jgi:hypothetical protein
MEPNATERLTQALFNAILEVVDDFKSKGDRDALSKLGPILLTTGAMVLNGNLGRETTTYLVQDLADRVERGDFEGINGVFHTPAAS